MKRDKFLMLAGTIASILTVQDTFAACNADPGYVCSVGSKRVCPSGCFCLGGSQNGNASYLYSTMKRKCSDASISFYDLDLPDYGFDGWEALFLGDNTDWYYGFDENGEFQYSQTKKAIGMFVCPRDYPQSAEGASKLEDCFKYDEKGKKIYFSRNKQTISCSEGTYLPAGTTKCRACETSKNQVCPGGKFEKSDIKNQGLKVICNPGQYLPEFEIQCVTCDKKYYLCPGGTYEADVTIDQGRIRYDGYINNIDQSTGIAYRMVSCKPGYYLPAKSNTCAACMGDYACPGGTFNVDSMAYIMDRGAVLCGYGHPNAKHTECIMDNSKPSYMKKKLEGIKSNSAASVIATNSEVYCAAGYYLPANKTACKVCKTGYTCAGGTFKPSTKNQGLVKNVKVADDDMIVVPTTNVNRAAYYNPTPKYTTVSRERISVPKKEVIDRKPKLHRASKSIPQNANSIRAEIIRDSVKNGRPSKYKERHAE